MSTDLYAELAKLISYDPETGDLRWKLREPRTKRDATFNEKYAGKPAGCRTWRYDRILFRRKTIPFHRLVWFMVFGPIPKGLEIDHINGDAHDNRIANLRLATTKINARNRRLRKDNSTGFQGVYESKHGTFYAQECVNGRNRHLGTFPTFEQAVAARIASQQRVGGFHPNHGRKA